MAPVAALLVAAAASSAGPTCRHALDNPHDPRHAPVRAGDDFQCLSMPDGDVEGCAAACCAAAGGRCRSFSWNAPWALSASYMGCEPGKNCCCLKSDVAPLGPNHWQMNITTGVATPPPPPLCVAEGVCCSLNGKVVAGRCVCASGWRGADCGELDLLPVPNLDGACRPPAPSPLCLAPLPRLTS